MSHAAFRVAPELRGATAPRIASVTVALPRNTYPQSALLGVLERRWRGDPKKLARLARFHDAVGVTQRSLALPIEAYDELRSFGASNDAFIRAGTELGAEAIRGALDAAGLAPADVDAIFFTTVTGLATPSIDARLVNVLGLRSDVRRVPMFGLGCVGGAAGLARAADHARAYPDDVVVLLSVELCSLTLQDDLSVANLVATGLFGDGAAAVVLGGGGRGRGPRVVASKSAFFPGTERVMGWDIGATGFKVVLSADVPRIAKQELPPVVDRFLAEEGLTRADIQRWVCHPGGPKVIDAIEEGFGLAAGALDATRRSLAEIGNVSSASVLDVLARTPAERGDLGVLLAMGPGFCAEAVLLAW